MTVRSGSAGSFTFVPVTEIEYVAHSTSTSGGGGAGTIYPTGYYNSTSTYNETWEHPQDLGSIAKYLSRIDPADLKKLVNIFETNARSLEDHLDVAYLKTSGGTVYGSTTLAGDVNLLGTVRVEDIPLVSLLPPTGSITMYGGSAAPPGWLRCNGAEVSRTSYLSLFQTIGTQYGAGNGSTTFNLPNLQGKFPLGGTSNRGTTGGEANVTLTTAQMPDHSHDVGTYTIPSAVDHDHSFSHTHNLTNKYFQFPFNAGGGASLTALDNTGAAIPGANVANSGVTSSQSSTTTGLAGAHDHTISGSSESTGGGGSHNNMPPYQVVDYIIKT